MRLTTIKRNAGNLQGWHFLFVIEKDFSMLDDGYYYFGFGIFNLPEQPVIGYTLKSQIGIGFLFDFTFHIPKFLLH